MANRWRDWLMQAEQDLEHARLSVSGRHYNWACFAAHQAAEKALKALYLSYNAEGWGHAVRELLIGVGEDVPVPEGLLTSAGVLDQYYIPTRYPNGFASGKPADYYGPPQAAEAIGYAEAILRFCQDHLGPAGRGGGGAAAMG